MKRLIEWLKSVKQKDGGTQKKRPPGDSNNGEETKSANFSGLKMLKWELLLVGLLPGALLVLAGLWLLGLVTGVNMSLGDLGRGLMIFLRVITPKKKPKPQETTTSKPN